MCAAARCAQGRSKKLRRKSQRRIHMTTKHRIFMTSFASVYPLYVAKAEKKGRSKSEVDAVTRWLTEGQLKKQKDFETFFKEAHNPFGSSFGHFRLGRHANPKRLSWITTFASAHPDLLASDWMGHLRVTSVFSELVVDVWNAQPSGLEF